MLEDEFEKKRTGMVNSKNSISTDSDNPQSLRLLLEESFKKK